jgi:TolB-like protein/Tfp pilus assembly protein PilF
MFTDIVGYTALMAESEEKGLRVRERHRSLLGPLAEQHHGEVVDENGDELVLSFPSALDAVNCALAVQTELRNDPDLRLRIGIHLGDVVFEDGRVYGDGVNVASRIRPLSEPAGICVSDEVQHSIQNQENIESRSLGRHELKNIPRPVEVFAVGRPGSVTVGRRRRGRTRFWSRGRSAVAALVLAVVALIAWRIWEQTRDASAGPIRSIAVLPLENLSGDPEQEYFADGMTEAVISEFARIGSLRVISRTSVMRYKQSEKSLPEIARELGVDGVIEGTVMRDGDRVRITAQLIDARNDSHLWSDRYDRDLSGILALQSEVARTVAERIRLELTPQERDALAETTAVDPRAHDLYLRAVRHASAAMYSVQERREAIAYFERAVEADPSHARAWAGLASAHLSMLSSWVGREEALQGARAAALEAIRLDPSLGTAHTTLGIVHLMYDWDWVGAEAELLRALELSPNDPTTLASYSFYMALLGRHEEAIAAQQQATLRSPLDRSLRLEYAVRLYYARRYKEAIEEWQKILDLHPDLPRGALGNLWAVTYWELGREEEAFLALQEVSRTLGAEHVAKARARAYEGGGFRAAFRAGLEARMAEAREGRFPSFVVAAGLARLGEADVAMEWLERAYRLHDPFMPLLNASPAFDAVRTDPRFQELLRRIGFPES